MHFQAGCSHATGLPDGCADIVTWAQSLRWMEPGSTFAKVSAILRTNGVFAAQKSNLPPAMHWEPENAVLQVHQRIHHIAQAHGRNTRNTM
ncbi:MAG: hypothetical protein JW910_13535 [Anaerolineae bacterium]|nr:hypothetical protein [Anaerolineae bacterium]